jgi:hypothetical protein
MPFVPQQVADYLNLDLGIVHGDIRAWNLLINPETDTLQIFDFNMASKLGNVDCESFRYERHRNDVKLTVFTLYEIITGDLHHRETWEPHDLNETPLLRRKDWRQGEKVHLDSPVSEYRDVLQDWVNTRKRAAATFKHYGQASNAISWPPMPEFPLVPIIGSMQQRRSELLSEMVNRGAKFIKWQRPASCQLPLPPGQRLLATGEIVEDDRRDYIPRLNSYYFSKWD